jgi:peptidoglycan-associated lipoprotein
MRTQKRFFDPRSFQIRKPKFLFLVIVTIISCTYTIKIKDGRTAYERKQFARAIPMLKKEYGGAKLRSEKGQLAYMLGDALRRTGQDERSLEWFKTAYDNNYGADALKGQAYALKKLERYPEAREAFKNLGIEIGSPYEYRKEIAACNTAEAWLKDASDNGWKIEPAPFNSTQNDFAPANYADGRLVFTSDRAMSTGEAGYNWTGNRFMDLFIVEPDDASPQLLDPALNSAGNEGSVCFNSSGSEIFFSRARGAYKGDDAYCKIYVATRSGDAWNSAQPLPFQKEKINYFHPALSADGNTLYFACNDPEGWGGYDLYSVQRSAKNDTGWETPKLLSRNINTPGNELFPSVDADTLYFASDGLPGMGGLDIFRSYKIDRNAWAAPQNLQAPLNSGADEFGFTVDRKAAEAQKRQGGPLKVGDLIRAGFYTSNRSGGRGGDDIFRYEQRVPPPKPVKKDTAPVKAIVYKMLLEGYVLEKVLANPDDPNSKVLGRKPLGGTLVEIDFEGKKQKVTVKDDGYFKLELAENSDYKFAASQSGYLANNARFSTKGIARDPKNPTQVFEIEIVLDKIYHNREIVLENIYYDYDKWDSAPTPNRRSTVWPKCCAKTRKCEFSWAATPIAGATTPTTKNCRKNARKARSTI